MADPPWLQPCIQDAKDQGGVLCPQTHCDSTLIKNYTHDYCYCQGKYVNGCRKGRVDGCCPWSDSTAVPVADKDCFCCCGCLANNTPVAIDASNYKPIAEFAVGDLVYVADDVSLSSWSQKTVKFSSGAGDVGASNTMIKVTYGGPDSSSDYLLVNRAQLFLMHDRTLKTAATLIPGADSLVDMTGAARPVLSLEVGTFKLGLHHIATSTRPAQSPDGHLILAKDIVCGDWALQVTLYSNDLEKVPLAANHAALPQFGTPGYQTAHAHLEHTAFRAAVPDVQHAAPPTAEFVSYSATPGVYIPENANGFVTANQANELFMSNRWLPPTNNARKTLVTHLFTLFSGFYPDITFFYDVQNPTPNAFFFEEYGQKTFVLTGGLVRMEALGYDGLAFIVARSVAADVGDPPLNDDGYGCVGQTDYTAVSAIIPYVWIGLTGIPVAKNAIAQLTDLFTDIKQYRNGTGSCMNPSIDCRLQSMQAALDLLPLPHCAGGPPDPLLEVSGASGVTGTPHGQVTISFNLAVDPETAQDLGNYVIDPHVASYSAAVVSGDPKSVVVEADVEAGQEYSLDVVAVLSSDQQPLIPGKSEATFTVPQPSEPAST